MSAVEEIGVRCGVSSRTYPELFARSLRLAAGLARDGCGAGDRIALLLRNSLEFVESSIATVPLGASAVPINWHWRGDEIAHVLTDSRAKALVLHADLWPAIADSVPDDVAIIAVADAGGAAGASALPVRALRYERVIEENP